MNAIFTLQHNEQFYLPKWIKYYSEFFSMNDMYILAHNCTGITNNILQDAEDNGINIIELTTDEIFNHDWLTSTVHEMQRELLGRYDYVVFTDCDEFIVPTNCRLDEFLDKATEEAYRCEGFDCIGDNIYPNPRFFNKTLITRVPLNYENGYHSVTKELPVNKDLILFHIHRLDYTEALERNKRLASEKWDNKAIEQNLGRQNSLLDIDAFDRWYYEGKDIAFRSPLFNGLLEVIC